MLFFESSFSGFRPKRINSHTYATLPDGTQIFSYLLTCEVYVIEVLEIMAQMGPYMIF